LEIGGEMKVERNLKLAQIGALEERGIKLETRKDALRTFAESYIAKPGLMAWYSKNRGGDTIRIAKDWHCDGAILGLNQGSPLTTGQMEVKWSLQKDGIPTLLYEANMANPKGD
jgi:benzoyl-CoA reductase/2-hydroxyglutaryl-CoA dehydratase subunit BcrC/BadD/HgdB